MTTTEAQNDSQSEFTQETAPVEHVNGELQQEESQADIPDWKKHFQDAEVIPIASHEEPEPYDVQRSDPIESGWLRGAAVLGGVGFLVAMAGIAVFAFTGGFNSSETAQEENSPDKRIAKVDSRAKEISDLKGQLIFSRQGNEDDKIRKGKAKSSAVKVEKVRSVSTPPTPSAAGYSSTPMYSGGGSSRPSPSAYTQSVRSIPVVASLPSSVSQPSALSYIPPRPQSQPVDASRRWKDLADASTYNVEGVEAPQVASVQQNQTQNVSDWHSIQGTQETPSSSLGITIPRGTEAIATLQLPAVVGAAQTILTLDSAISSQGSVLIPAGTKIIAQVDGGGGGIALKPVSAELNGLDIPLSGADSIMVLQPNKKPLIAKSFSGHGLGGVLSFGLNAIGGAADTILSSGSSVTTTNGSGSTISVSGIGRSFGNSALGAARGGIQSIVQGQQRGNSGQSSASGLAAGQKVRLVFMSAVSL